MKTWQKELAESVRTLDDLAATMPLGADERQQLADVLAHAPMAIPRYYLSLIDFADPDDPIRKLAIPSPLEEDRSGSDDTSGEAQNTVAAGLQHKYRETVLMLSTTECAMYCRHCFRKRLVGLPDKAVARNIDVMRDYLLSHPEVNNVLVSGGDALLNSNARLDAILDALTQIPHLDFIRLATRTPVTLPSRITGDAELRALLARYQAKKQLYLVTQFDHPREITPASTAAVAAVRELGIPVRNQTVLLRGVNDSAEVLGSLLAQSTAIGAEPYYIFQCRPVSRVKNRFQVPLREGRRIVDGATALQNGIGKAFRYCMSHVTGKIEILGEPESGSPEDEPAPMLLKYHEAKNPADRNRLFTATIAPDQAWLD